MYLTFIKYEVKIIKPFQNQTNIKSLKLGCYNFSLFFQHSISIIKTPQNIDHRELELERVVCLINNFMIDTVLSSTATGINVTIVIESVTF